MFSWFTQTWFMQGIMHPLQTPSHLILILGLGFLIGQQGKLKLLALPPFFVLSGFLLNQYSSLHWNTELILLALSLISGILLIFRIKLPLSILLVLLMVCGVILGLDSSPLMIPGLGFNSIVSWLLGAAITINAGLIAMSLFAYFLNHFWNGIILRVAGSWIATSAIFVLTLSIAGI